MRVSLLPAKAGLFLLIPFAVAAPAAAQPFVHPGALNNQEEFTFIAGRIKAGAQPWKQAFDQMRANDFASTARAIHPRATVECGSYSNPDNGCTEEKEDADAAYTQALLWRLTGDEAYAKKAVSIVDGWAQVLVSHTNTNAPLQAAWAGAVFPLAAELLRGYPGWTQAHADRFARMMRTAFLPLFENGSTSNGNWELTMIDAMTQTAVALDDRALFDKAMAMWRKRVPAYFYLSSDGAFPVQPPGKAMTQDALVKFWFSPSKFEDGIAQETCRDYAHLSFGIAATINVAETALQQGVDLYDEEKKRLMAGLEFNAQFLADAPIPSWLCGGHLDLQWQPTWEIAYNHYHNRLGLDLPMTKKVIAKIRPTNAVLHMTWETMTHAELGSRGLTTAARPAERAPATAGAGPRLVFTGAGMFRVVWTGTPRGVDGKTAPAGPGR